MRASRWTSRCWWWAVVKPSDLTPIDLHIPTLSTSAPWARSPGQNKTFLFCGRARQHGDVYGNIGADPYPTAVPSGGRRGPKWKGSEGRNSPMTHDLGPRHRRALAGLCTGLHPSPAETEELGGTQSFNSGPSSALCPLSYESLNSLDGLGGLRISLGRGFGHAGCGRNVSSRILTSGSPFYLRRKRGRGGSLSAKKCVVQYHPASLIGG
jgi:hypothetical protein